MIFLCLALRTVKTPNSKPSNDVSISPLNQFPGDIGHGEISDHLDVDELQKVAVSPRPNAWRTSLLNEQLVIDKLVHKVALLKMHFCLRNLIAVSEDRLNEYLVYHSP